MYNQLYEKKENYDIVAIQESHIMTDEEAAQWELLWGGTLFYSSGTARSLGQMLLINIKTNACIGTDI